MAKFSVTKILSEQFRDMPGIPQLLGPINDLIDSVSRALNNQLTITDNFDGVIKTVTVDGTYPQKFKWPRATKPVVAWIGYAREISGVHVTFAAPLFLDWEYDGDGNFRINAIPGLSATMSAKYYVTIVALAG